MPAFSRRVFRPLDEYPPTRPVQQVLIKEHEITNSVEFAAIAVKLMPMDCLVNLRVRVEPFRGCSLEYQELETRKVAWYLRKSIRGRRGAVYVGLTYEITPQHITAAAAELAFKLGVDDA